MNVKLNNYISCDLIFTDLPQSPKEDLLRIFLGRICQRVPELPEDTVINAVLNREASESTAIGGGVAFPHCRLDGFDRIIVSVGVCKEGVDYDAPDKQPVYLLISIIGPNTRSEEYLYILAQIARVMSDRKRRQRIVLSGNPSEIYTELESVI